MQSDASADITGKQTSAIKNKLREQQHYVSNGNMMSQQNPEKQIYIRMCM